MDSIIFMFLRRAFGKWFTEKVDPYHGEEAPWMKTTKYILLGLVLLCILAGIIYGLVLNNE